jgi:pilus assembly protein CpaB
MRSKSIILLAVALGCGLIASIGISQLMDPSNKNADAGDRQPVFVAMTDINASDELTAQNIKLEEWPKAIVPAGALTQLEDVEGKRCRMKIYAGEPILSSKLLGPNESIGAAKEIPPGYRVAHVTVDGATGTNNLILPGDRVDVLVFRNTNASDTHATAAKIVLQDIKVFAVDTHTETEYSKTRGEQTEPMTARTIALLVTPRQSEILHAATEMSGAIRLVLRNPEDDTHYVSEGATISDIFGPEAKTKRDGEKTGDSDSTADGGDMSNWLATQKSQPPTPPAQPPLPVFGQAQQVANSKMIVMYGSEVMQVEIPADGSPPTNPQQGTFSAPPAAPSGSSLLGGGIGPTPQPPIAEPPADGNEPAPGNDDSIDGVQQGSIDSNQPSDEDGTQEGSIDGTDGQFIEDSPN